MTDDTTTTVRECTCAFVRGRIGHPEDHTLHRVRSGNGPCAIHDVRDDACDEKGLDNAAALERATQHKGKSDD